RIHSTKRQPFPLSIFSLRQFLSLFSYSSNPPKKQPVLLLQNKPTMTYFLKQLTEDSITHERLLIPAEFVKKCGRENLTNPLVVEPTVGDPRERELELYEDGGVLWLRNGWQEFVDHYKLSHGCFLLFEYRSYSRFKLLMLGANGLELELPVSGFVNVGLNGNQEFPEDEEEESVDANSVEILGSSVVKEMNNNVEGGGRQPAQPRCAENAKQNGVMSARKRRAADDGEWRKANQEGPRANRANGNPFRRDKAESSRIPSMTEHEDEPAFSRRPSNAKPGGPTTTVDEDYARLLSACHDNPPPPPPLYVLNLFVFFFSGLHGLISVDICRVIYDEGHESQQ
ncbi:unnamed protein product, partial [Linum tenue]